jgi:hypothetical protein
MSLPCDSEIVHCAGSTSALPVTTL